MIFTLSIIINLCLIFAIYEACKAQDRNVRYLTALIKAVDNNARQSCVNPKKVAKSILGQMDREMRKVALAEKIAERAFNLASSATLAVVALQKTLATPRILTKEQGQRNLLAKKEIDELFTNKGMMDWLKPTLSDEEMDLLEKAEEHNAKFNGKTN